MFWTFYSVCEDSGNIHGNICVLLDEPNISFMWSWHELMKICRNLKFYISKASFYFCVCLMPGNFVHPMLIFHCYKLYLVAMLLARLFLCFSSASTEDAFHLTAIFFSRESARVLAKKTKICWLKRTCNTTLITSK